jgi:hypothetical protein
LRWLFGWENVERRGIKLKTTLQRLSHSGSC